MEAGTLELGPNGTLTLKPTTNGTSNRITGTGTLVLKGTLSIDRSAANQTNGNTWNLIDIAGLSESYEGTFAVAGFTKNGSDWDLGREREPLDLQRDLRQPSPLRWCPEATAVGPWQMPAARVQAWTLTAMA